MAFFDEFPHTRTYDSDLAWLIRRMKEVLARMDSVEERMAALEELMRNFLDTADDMLREIIEQMIADGSFSEILASLLAQYGSITYNANEHVGYYEYNLDGSRRDMIVNTGIYDSIAKRYTIHTPTSGELTLTMNLMKDSFLEGGKLFSILDLIDVDTVALFANEHYDGINSFVIGEMIPVTATMFLNDGTIVDVKNGYIKISEHNSVYIDTIPHSPLCKLASLHIPNFRDITFNAVQVAFTVKMKRK